MKDMSIQKKAVAFLEEMLELIYQEQMDVVIGSRFVKKKGFQSSQMRRL